MPFAFRELNCRAFLFALLFHSTLTANPLVALPAFRLFCEMISQAVIGVIRKMYEWTRVPQTNEKKKLFENAFSSINFKQYINFTFILFSSIINTPLKQNRFVFLRENEWKYAQLEKRNRKARIECLYKIYRGGSEVPFGEIKIALYALAQINQGLGNAISTENNWDSRFHPRDLCPVCLCQASWNAHAQLQSSMKLYIRVSLEWSSSRVWNEQNLNNNKLISDICIYVQCIHILQLCSRLR